MKAAAPFAALVLMSAAAVAQPVASAAGATVRALDKVSGATEDLEIASGGSASFGRLNVDLSDCRFPVDDPSSNAFAHLTIRDTGSGNIEFDGWMIASSPALSALDDPRYDVWLLRCNNA